MTKARIIGLIVVALFAVALMAQHGSQTTNTVQKWYIKGNYSTITATTTWQVVINDGPWDLLEVYNTSSDQVVLLSPGKAPSDTILYRTLIPYGPAAKLIHKHFPDSVAVRTLSGTAVIYVNKYKFYVQ